MKYLVFILTYCSFAVIYAQNNNNNINSFTAEAEHTVKLGIDAVKEQIALHSFPYSEECLAEAIKQNNKEIVEYICSQPGIKIDYQITLPDVQMPLLAVAVQYWDKQDFSILQCLLKAGASPHQKYYVRQKCESPSRVTTPQEFAELKHPEIYELFRMAKDPDFF